LYFYVFKTLLFACTCKGKAMTLITSRILNKLNSTSEFITLSIKGKVAKGYCCICDSQTLFIEKNTWLRDFYFCNQCYSIPRQRAIIVVLNQFFPEWKNLKIHESSPGGSSSTTIEKRCTEYTPTQFFQDVPFGDLKDGIRCENLEKMTFEDNSFDLTITQDVFEHVMNPLAAFKEIERTLKPGGAHVFTMPWYPQLNKTVQRARQLDNGEIEFLEEAIYHGNPIDSKGSLVTFDWGVDFVDLTYINSGMSTTIYREKDRSKGIDGEFLEVFISRKSQ
jgi:SAM-dependent methyltransferase